MRKPIVGVTMGDAAGIGPEIILMALARREVRAAGDYVVYGLPEVMARAAALVGWKGEIREAPEGEEFLFKEGLLNVVRCGAGSLDGIDYGAVSARCGQLAFDAIKRAIEDALAERIDATASAPLNKEALSQAGIKFPGHTEIYAHFTNTIEYAMLLMEGNFRVAHISTHVSLFDAIKAVKKERVATVIRLVHEALTEMGIRKPRIAVAGLNPHAGENGLFGREEIEEIGPAVAQTASLGAVGPLPPDSVFSRAAGGEFDAVIAMYHDQGHIPLKMVGFRYCECEAEGPSISGINVTLGSPVIRCSVDHGTAFNIAGTGSADPGSMATAMITAAEMAAGAMIRRKGATGAGFIKE
ncbi:MAG: 4-hydroxythreonine-4-phosphate dehydrogenase PdxA [Rectinemataceae bacterium]|nr:4-hydroxythreonine-4-phosphate dehydrogenase PdxA [Rectinemataceae bacterium]